MSTSKQDFVFEIKTLSSDRVELRPFDPTLHAQLLLDAHLADPSMAQWLPMHLQTLDDVHKWFEATFQSNSAFMLNAIFSDAPGDHDPLPREEWTFAGVIGIINASVNDMGAEPGHIQILKGFQRTHVLTHAVGLVLHRVLDSPAQGGLGLRRCQWFTNSLNVKSQAAALRLGFTHEGTLRNHRVLPLGKEGSRAPRPDSYASDRMGRDSWLASIIWEEWDVPGGRKEHIDTLMARRR